MIRLSDWLLDCLAGLGIFAISLASVALVCGFVFGVLWCGFALFELPMFPRIAVCSAAALVVCVFIARAERLSKSSRGY